MTARRRRITLPPHSQDRWFVSYADFVTLLFGFFVVMFACAETGRVKVLSQSVRTVMSSPIPRPVPNAIPDPVPKVAELQPTMDFLRVQLRSEIESGQMRLKLEPRGLVVTLSEAAFFPSGGDQVEPGLIPSIRKVADAVRDMPNPIRLEGHTDSQPIHQKRFRDNWELSAARALAMLQLLNGTDGIARERLAIAGYADTAPVAENETEEGRSRNRRVDIVILSNAAV
jgi:chemotaxis protein MotB